ncbi:MAG: arylesterase [Comamonas sp.]|nr:arylesterase [Comamonas sp.]
MLHPNYPPHLPHLLLRRRFLLASLAVGTLAACGKKSRSHSQYPALESGATVLALGDSLTQGVGTDAQGAWPSLLQEASGWTVVNAGVSGDTSAQALARLPDLLQTHQPELVIVGIGGNDFLRQIDRPTTQDNIRQIVQLAQDSGAQVLLLAVPQFSVLAASTGRLSDHPLYAELGKALDVPVYAKGWSQVLSNADWRSDQIHANTQGYAQYAQGLMAFLSSQGWLL